MLTNPNTTLENLIAYSKMRLEQIFTDCLRFIPDENLASGMAYSFNSGGKHIRPLLVYAAGQLFNAPLEALDVAACAVEIIHTYSLIHDDLPCMDNSDIRRGKPTSHKVYGEAMAVLIGDALHTLAMQTLATYPAPLKDSQRLRMIAALSTACGPLGMATGQALDITHMCNQDLSCEMLQQIYHLKTGALISASLELGRLASKNNNMNSQYALKSLGDCIGLAFQIQDDILDIESNTTVLGKPQGLDLTNQKITYVTLHGLTAAKDEFNYLYEKALEIIHDLGPHAKLLEELTTSLLARQN